MRTTGLEVHFAPSESALAQPSKKAQVLATKPSGTLQNHQLLPKPDLQCLQNLRVLPTKPAGTRQSHLFCCWGRNCRYAMTGLIHGSASRFRLFNLINPQDFQPICQTCLCVWTVTRFPIFWNPWNSIFQMRLSLQLAEQKSSPKAFASPLPSAHLRCLMYAISC